MKLLLHLCFVCMLMPSFAQQKKLFVAAGQSNAVGMGDSALSKNYSGSATFEYRFTGDSLIALADPVGSYELQFHKANKGSAWPSFAATYSNTTGKQVIIVQAARGGSSCSNKAELSNYGCWDTVAHLPLFDSAIIKIKAAQKKTGIPVSGIIWSQGERDANAINAGQLTQEEYQATMETLIERFRKALGVTVSFYIIQTGYYLHHPEAGFNQVRAAQENIARRVKGVYIVYNQTGSFEGKGWMKDEIHYNQAALNDIGQTIARKIILIEKK